MEIKSILFIILIMPLYGFGIGLHFDLIETGEMFRLQDLIKNAGLEIQDKPLVEDAFMNANVQGPITSATIDLGLSKVLVDNDGTPNSGDEYFDNLISECSFHSRDNIDPNSCVVCKFSDKEVPPEEECKNFWIDFEELADNAAHQDVVDYLLNNFGITLSVDFDQDNDPTNDEVTIYDSFQNGGCDPDDEHPLKPGDDLTVGNLLIMREDGTGSGCQPNDRAKGGTLTFQLAKSMYLESIDVVDHDTGADEDSVIRAYQTADCTGSFVEADILKKNFENSLQKVVVDAQDVLCFEIIYLDSGGFTNIHLRCIPCEGAWIDFEELAHGSGVADGDTSVVDYLNNFGITLTVDGANGIDKAIIYDSRYMGDNIDGCDFDLEHPLMPDDRTIGNLLVMKENDNCQPNDSGQGGMLTFQLDTPMYLESIDVVDHDNNGESSVIRAYQTADCTGSFVEADIVKFNKENSLQRVFVNADNILCFKINYFDSGGFTNIHLECVKDDVPPEDIWVMGDDANVIAKGQLLLPDGYKASDHVSIPLDNGGVDVQKVKTVEIDVITNNIAAEGGLVFGEIIVADDNTDSIIRVDPSTGKQTLISDDSKFKDPENVVIDSSGNILVSDGRGGPDNNGRILKVNPISGSVTVLSDGGFFRQGPEDLVLAPNGDIFVLDDGRDAVIKVNPINGNQELIVEDGLFSNRPEGIAIEADGMLIIADGNGAKIIRVDPSDGTQSLITSGDNLVRPEGVAVAADGSIFVADGNIGDDNTSGMGKIIKVHPVTGAQEVIIDGAPFVDPSDVEILPNGDLIVSDDAGGSDGMGAIYKVDPDTKMVMVISDNIISQNNGGVKKFDSPEGLAIVTLLPPENTCEKKVPPEEFPPQYRTQTQGGWGTECSGNNPGCYRDTNFDDAFPTDLIVGGDAADPIYSARFTQASAVENYLPAGTTAGAFNQDYVNPTSTSAGVFGGQVTALSLNVGFDLCSRALNCAPFAPAGTTIPLEDLIVVDNTSACFGMTVGDVLDEANLKISGQFSSLSFGQLNTCADKINNNYVDGTNDNGFLAEP